jgi:hypothetical protein
MRHFLESARNPALGDHVPNVLALEHGRTSRPLSPPAGGGCDVNNRARTIKRERRTKARIEQLDQHILDVLSADHPQSVRHVFYRMTDPRLLEPVEKSDRGYRHVQHRLKELRRDGRVPYNWITDATRRGYHVSMFADAGEFIRRMSGLYRADLWEQSDHYVEVWTESRSIAGVIEGECNDLAVSLYPCGGFSSISLAYEAAGEIQHIVDHTGRRPVILYIGDYDPAGVLIDQSLQAELRRHLSCDFQFFRLGITEAQIEQYDLPTKPRKGSDRRSLHVKETVEAEAMPAHILRQIVRGTVESYLPEDALLVARVAEESEREMLHVLADTCRGGGA